MNVSQPGEKDASNGPTESKFSVGQKVRVLSPKGDHSRKALVSFAHGDVENAVLVGIFRTPHLNVYDVMYEDLSEENDVPEFRIMFLEPFELEAPSADAEQLKEQGNKLFGLKDFVEAARYYQRAIAELSGRVSIGTTVIVTSGNTCNFLHGVVALMEGSNFEVLLSTGEDAEARLEHLTVVPDSLAARQLLQTLYKNLSRCSMKQQRNGWALRFANLAVAVSRTMIGETRSLDKALADCLTLRAKLLLHVFRPFQASRDIDELETMNPQGATELRIQLAQLKKKRHASNRKLAKDVAKWVDTAMSNFQQQQQQSRMTADLPIEIDDEEEEEEEDDNHSANRANSDLTGKPCSRPPPRAGLADSRRNVANQETQPAKAGEYERIGHLQVILAAVFLATLAILVQLAFSVWFSSHDNEWDSI